MIYHEVKPGNFLEIFLNLEELICLKKITNQKCKLKIEDSLKHIFDFSEFEFTREIPDDTIECDISDYVCIYENDFNDIYGSEFISYRKNQKGKIFRLDKFNVCDYNIRFSKPNFYESKYWSSDENYSLAMFSAFNFDISSEFRKKYDLSRAFKKLPLLIIDPSLVNDRIKFDFKECYYINNPGNFLINNGLIGHSIIDLIKNHNVSFSSVDAMLLLISLNCFSAVYGVPRDLIFNVIGKKVEQFIIGDQSAGTIEKFKFKKVNLNGSFEFSQMYLNLDRNELMSFLRFRAINNFG